MFDLRSFARQVYSIGCLVHLVVHLVARISIDLEVGTHLSFYCAVEALLHLSPHIFVVVASAQLLVNLGVSGLVNAIHESCGSRSSLSALGLSCFASKLRSQILQMRIEMTYVALKSAKSLCSAALC